VKAKRAPAAKADDKVTYKGVSYSVPEFVSLLDLAAKVHAIRGTPYYAKAMRILRRKAKAVKS